MLRDVASVCGDGRPVVAGRVRHVHAGQLADHRLVLEDRLEDALAHLRLVGRVRGQELAAPEDVVDDGWDVVVVDAGADERELLAGVDVPRRELLQALDDLLLREWVAELERPVETNAGGDVPEELLDARDADRLQHRLAIGAGQCLVGHCSARCALYASASMRLSASDASESRIRISQPLPYGSSFTVSGPSTTA